MVGSYENEVLTVRFLLNEIDRIILTKHPNNEMEVSLQNVSGSYYLDFKPDGLINAYGNVQNVIVKLSRKGTNGSAVLINSHFDSVPTSPG